MYLRSYLNKSCVRFTVICGFNYAVDIFVLRFIFIYIMSVHTEMQSWNEAIDVMMLKTTWRSECFMRIVDFKLFLFFYYFLLFWMLRELIIGTDFFCVWHFIEFVEHLYIVSQTNNLPINEREFFKHLIFYSSRLCR